MKTNNLNKCGCRHCLTERGVIKSGSITGHDLTTIQISEIEFVGMILCEICGNKRCPHATDHRNECTKSNEPGQIGSIYKKIFVGDNDHEPENSGEIEVISKNNKNYE